jgi:hypothetical protein
MALKRPGQWQDIFRDGGQHLIKGVEGVSKMVAQYRLETLKYPRGLVIRVWETSTQSYLADTSDNDLGLQGIGEHPDLAANQLLMKLRLEGRL